MTIIISNRKYKSTTLLLFSSVVFTATVLLSRALYSFGFHHNLVSVTTSNVTDVKRLNKKEEKEEVQCRFFFLCILYPSRSSSLKRIRGDLRCDVAGFNFLSTGLVDEV